MNDKNNELFDRLEAKLRQAADASGNVPSLVLMTDLVTQFIPIGTPLTSAKAKLEQSGFRIIKREADAGFDERYDAIRMSKQYGTIISSYEFGIVIQAKDGVVSSLIATSTQSNL